MIVDKMEIEISVGTLEKLSKVEKIMLKEGMAEQDFNFIIGRLADFFVEKKTNKLVRR